jgi:MFS family permease
MSFTSSRRDLWWVVLARSASFFGDEIATFALLLRMQERGAGAGAVAALLIANLAPMVLLAGVVGRVVDRRDSRSLLVASSLAQAVVCSALATVTSSAAVLVLVAALGAGQAVNAATWQALVPSIVAPDALPAALGRLQAATTVAGIGAPALAGLLSGWFGTRVPLLIDAATFLVVTLAAILIHTRRGAAGAASPPRAHGGFAIVRRDPLLRRVIALLGLFILLGAMVNVVEVFLVRETLHASALWYGGAGAAYASGVLVGALAAGRLRSSPALGRGFVGGAAVLGVGLVGMGVVPAVVVLLPVGFATGVGNGVLNVATGALVLGRAAADERGRVAALLGGVTSGTMLAAYAVGGELAGELGPRGMFVLAGTLGILAPALLGRGVLRAVRSPESPRLPAETGPARAALV